MKRPKCHFYNLHLFDSKEIKTPIKLKSRSKSKQFIDLQKRISEKNFSNHLLKCHSLQNIDRACTFIPTINKEITCPKSARKKIHKSLFNKLDYC